VELSERLKARVSLFVMLPMRAPVVPPLPIVSVPELMEVAPLTVRLPPEMPAEELMVSEGIERSPPRSVAVEFDEPVAEKTMGLLSAKFAGGVPPELLDQLSPADQSVPFEPSQ